MNPALLQKGSNSFRTDSEIKDHEGTEFRLNARNNPLILESVNYEFITIKFKHYYTYNCSDTIF